MSRNRDGRSLLGSRTTSVNNVPGRWFQVAKGPSWFGDALRVGEQMAPESNHRKSLFISSGHYRNFYAILNYESKSLQELEFIYCCYLYPYDFWLSPYFRLTLIITCSYHTSHLLRRSGHCVRELCRMLRVTYATLSAAWDVVGYEIMCYHLDSVLLAQLALNNC